MPTIWEQMGGPMGMVDSGLPVVVFIVANAIGGARLGDRRRAGRRPWSSRSCGSPASGRSPRPSPACSASGSPRSSPTAPDSAKGYFLLGIWSYLLYGGALLLSMLVRWPAIGVIWEGINGRGTAWRKDQEAGPPLRLCHAGLGAGLRRPVTWCRTTCTTPTRSAGWPRSGC